MTEPHPSYAIAHLEMLTPEQAAELDAALRRVLAHGWGTISITITNHAVDLLTITVSNKINAAPPG